MAETDEEKVPATVAPDEVAPTDEPPVVARMVIEIRSDGRRTIARGAMEDHLTGEKVGLEARGASPGALAASLVRSIVEVPFLSRLFVRGPNIARNAARALLPKRRR